MASDPERSPKPRKLALLIGNNDYSRADNKLGHSVQNVTCLGALLQTMKFEIIEMHENVQRDENLNKFVHDFSKKITDGDLVLFYYSGHACQVEGQDYFITVDDAQIEAPRDVPLYSATIKNTFERLVEKNRSFVTVFVMDCYGSYQFTNGAAKRVKSEDYGALNPDNGAYIQLIHSIKKKPTSGSAQHDANSFSRHLLMDITEENTKIVDVFDRVASNVLARRQRKHKISTVNKLLDHQDVCLYHVEPPKVSTLAKIGCPRGLFLAPKQSFVIADFSNHSIIKFQKGAQTRDTIVGRNMPGHRTQRLCAPSTVVFHKATQSYIICDQLNRRVVQKTLGHDAPLKVLIENIACFGIAVDNDGFIYVSDTERQVVVRHGVDGRGGTIVAGGHGRGCRRQQLNHPTYIFVDKDKSLYVSDSWNDRVMKWEKDATEGLVVAGGKGRGKHRTQLNCPAGLAVDRTGTVYVADRWNHRVMRWSKNAPHGYVVAGHKYFAGDKADELNGPEGLVLDKDGNLYVADAHNHRIQQITFPKS